MAKTKDTCRICKRTPVHIQTSDDLCGRCKGWRVKGLNDEQIVEVITHPDYTGSPGGRRPEFSAEIEAVLAKSAKEKPLPVPRVPKAPKAQPASRGKLALGGRTTKDRKLKIEDTIYVLRVPKELDSLDPVDIVKNGRVLLIREGIKESTNVFGEILGIAGKGWNPIPPMVVDRETVRKEGLVQLVSEAVLRTRRQIEAEEKHPEKLLPQLKVDRHKGERIERDEDDDGNPYYYIKAQVWCPNCREPVAGRTVLELNRYGKVGRELPFTPDDPNVYLVPGTRKMMHPECAPKKLAEEVEEEIRKAAAEAAECEAQQRLEEVLEKGDLEGFKESEPPIPGPLDFLEYLRKNGTVRPEDVPTLINRYEMYQEEVEWLNEKLSAAQMAVERWQKMDDVLKVQEVLGALESIVTGEASDGVVRGATELALKLIKGGK